MTACSLFSSLLQISTFSTCSNLTLVLLWVVMIFLVYYIKNMSGEVKSMWRTFLLIYLHMYMSSLIAIIAYESEFPECRFSLSCLFFWHA